jgi:hypothetical protein
VTNPDLRDAASVSPDSCRGQTVVIGQSLYIATDRKEIETWKHLHKAKMRMKIAVF